MSKRKVALIVVFNHRYDKNIALLEGLYRYRFSHIYYLVPFYDGNRSDVIPVYENSFYFQGYFSQGFKHYFHEEFEHYFFVADDMILNPEINENNYQQHFKISKDSSFIPEIFSLDNFFNNDTLLVRPHGLRGATGNTAKFTWCRTVDAIWYSPKKDGLESMQLPAYEKAEEIIKRHGYDIKPLRYSDLYDVKLSGDTESIRKVVSYVFKEKIRRKNYRLNYPVVASYSDLVIVSAGAIQKFVHYCGAFAATELFVEMAVPTALLLSCDKVLTEPVIRKRGALYWLYTDQEKENYQQEMKKFDFKISKLVEDFPQNKLYIHPIKLSQWKKE